MPQVERAFRAYQTELQVDLCFQSFEHELANLPGDYAPPRGAILLAESVSDPREVIGCGALRTVDASFCELKRLYVDPKYRGNGLGRRIVEALLDRAREMGLKGARLDTLKSLRPAIGLYESLGFLRCAPYNDTKLSDVIFFELLFDQTT